MSQLTPLVLKSIGSVSNSNVVKSISSKLFNGYIYVTGAFIGTLNIGGGIPPISTNSKNGSIFIAKYNNNFVPLALIGSSDNSVDNYSVIVSLDISTNGDIYVTGTFNGTLNIGGGIPPISTISKVGDMFIAKYNNNLVPLELIGSSNNSANTLVLSASLSIATNGDIYVTGTFNGTLNIGGGIPPISGNSTSSPGFIAKYNNNFVPLALKGLFAKNNNVLSTCLAIASNGDIYVTGGFNGTLNIGGGIPPISNIGEDNCGFIAKYNNNLSPLVLKNVSSKTDNNNFYSIFLAIASNGDIYVTGSFGGTLNIGGGIPPISTISIRRSGFIAKYNKNFVPLALKGLSGKTVDDYSLGSCLAIAKNGDVYVNGLFDGTLNVGGGISPIYSKDISGFLLVLNSKLKVNSLNLIINETPAGNLPIYKNISIDYSTGELILTGTFLGSTDIGGSVPPVTLSDKTLLGVFLAKYITNIEPICLVADTPISTDQGIVAIQNIDTAIHTIRGKPIVAITKAITPEKHLICFEQHAMGINLPNKRTIMTPGHEVLYKGKLVQAKHFVGKIDGVHTVPYDGKVVYNVLLEKHGLMVVNNMTVETLHPENKVAKMILGSK